MCVCVCVSWCFFVLSVLLESWFYFKTLCGLFHALDSQRPRLTLARQRCHLRRRLGLQRPRVTSTAVGLIEKCNLALMSLFDTRPLILIDVCWKLLRYAQAGKALQDFSV